MTEAKIIVIDDNAAVLKTLGIVFRGAFTTVVTVGDSPSSAPDPILTCCVEFYQALLSSVPRRWV